ncbi:hypothetical protein HC341_02175 [Aquisalimonas sp. 2447]|uniref:PD-(D/E)XK nuclease-like domain-containing protein n=1 Tax=Aquisalimonas sp. 2447 TaxID=2740807 RepID=UPI0014326778|nr:PD-(D/E)XK nuclease-like domain-containing protein [Aquisalimonas sp. 2447]QIT54127.1 hypothetical protein HC341_02175 [Aquisalimonas sp. 2447]
MSTATATTTHDLVGIHPGVAAADYHAAPGVSSTILKDVLRSPLHCWARHIDPERQPSAASEAMKLGTAVHTASLEPERWDREIAVAPRVDRRTKAGREAWASFQEEAAGRTVLTAEQAERAESMAEAVRGHPAAAGLLSDGLAECSLWHAEGPELVKVRPDWWAPAALVDLKTTRDAGPAGFARQVAQMRYHLQAALYVDVVGSVTGETLPWYWIAVESEQPHAVAVYRADAETLARGRELYRRALALYSECRRSGRWPGYPESVQEIRLPGWALHDEPGQSMDDPEF